MIEQRRSTRQGRFDGGHFVRVRPKGRHGRRVGLSFEVGIPVEIGDSLVRARIRLDLGGGLDSVARNLRDGGFGLADTLGLRFPARLHHLARVAAWFRLLRRQLGGVLKHWVLQQLVTHHIYEFYS